MVSELTEETEEVGFGLEIPWKYFSEGDDFSCERFHRMLIQHLAMSNDV